METKNRLALADAVRAARETLSYASVQRAQRRAAMASLGPSIRGPRALERRDPGSWISKPPVPI